MFYTKNANDSIRTADVWRPKQLLHPRTTTPALSGKMFANCGLKN